MRKRKRASPPKYKNLALAIRRSRAVANAERLRVEELLAVLREAIMLWANSSTGSTVRYREQMLKKKQSIVEGFFCGHKKTSRPSYSC